MIGGPRFAEGQYYSKVFMPGYKHTTSRGLKIINYYYLFSYFSLRRFMSALGREPNIREYSRLNWMHFHSLPGMRHPRHPRHPLTRIIKGAELPAIASVFETDRAHSGYLFEVSVKRRNTHTGYFCKLFNSQRLLTVIDNLFDSIPDSIGAASFHYDLCQRNPILPLQKPRNNQMEYVKLGNNGLDVSRLCLGCMSFGVAERWHHPWVLDEERSRPIIKKALDFGINFFDMANVYAVGTSKEIVGRALKDYANRDEIILATKVYNRMHEGPNGAGLSRKAIIS
jgi:hypothetical protein